MSDKANRLGKEIRPRAQVNGRGQGIEGEVPKGDLPSKDLWLIALSTSSRPSLISNCSFP